MTRKLSMRWRLILSTVTVAAGLALVFVLYFEVRNEQRLIAQLERTLGTKCDEVITVLESGESGVPLQPFLAIETTYRVSPHRYFYQISDGHGRIQAQSENLRAASLPIPAALAASTSPEPVVLETIADPTTTANRRVLRLRSERVTLRTGREVLIQVAASLDPIAAAMHQHRVSVAVYALVGLAAAFVLAWFVTTRCLRPVAKLTKTASEISATNLRGRLPVGGSGDELDELAGVLNAMLSRLDQAMQQMEQFTSDAAHQLRTPLTRIRGELDLLLRNGIAGETRRQLERVQEEIDRLSRTCSRLLFLARLDQESGRRTAFTERVNMAEVVSELIEQMAPVASEKGLALLCDRLLAVQARGSKVLIVEALLNLFHNAVRFTPAGGVIDVSVDGSNGSVTVAIRDSGPGIPAVEREQIFSRFYRGRAATADGEPGTGLGLAIVRSIATAHGGTVRVDPVPGSGSCFRLTLPSAEPQHS